MNALVFKHNGRRQNVSADRAAAGAASGGKPTGWTRSETPWFSLVREVPPKRRNPRRGGVSAAPPDALKVNS